MTVLKTEDDTYRVLSRKPMHVVYDTIFKRLMLGYIKTEKDLIAEIERHGYTHRDYLEYNRI